MTYGVSISTWKINGVLDRELSLYLKLLEHNYIKKITFIDYGDINSKKILKKYSNKFDHISLIDYSKKNLLYKSSLIKLFIVFRNLINIDYNQIDIIKTKQFKGAFIALIIKYLYKIKVIIRFGYDPIHFYRGYFKKLYFFYVNFVFKKSDFIIYTELNSNETISLINELNYKSIKINNFVDQNIFSKKKNISKKILNFIFIGRLEVQKNIPRLLSLIKNLKFENFIVIGVGSNKKYLKHNLCIKNVHFYENLNQLEISKLLEKSDCLIAPSYFEGQPKTVLESMSKGVITICSNIKSHNQIITDKFNGLIAKKDNDSSYIDQIDFLSQNPDQISIIANNSNKFIKNNFSLDLAVKKEISVYMNINATSQ